MFLFKNSGENILKFLILIGFSLLFYNTLTAPSLSQVIGPQFIGNAKLGFALLLALTAIQLVKTVDRHHKSSCGCHHKTGRLGYILFIGTLTLGLLVPISPLGATTASQKGIKFMQTGSAAPVSLPALPAEQPALLITDENHVKYVTACYENTAAFTGKTISMKGFVCRPDQLPSQQFLVARFEISCCAADAVPSGFMVEWNDGQSVKNDSWVEVHGQLDTFEYLGNKLPVIKATQVIPIQPLATPYVYTNNYPK